MASVRFICGTQTLHKRLEHAISDFLQMQDTILYSSCFDANGGVFEVLFGSEDAIISDELNHASLIDGIRLSKAARYRYRNADMDDLEAQLVAAKDARRTVIVTDGVFSMDGYFAPWTRSATSPRSTAPVMVDDSHAVGFIGNGGRGTPEHFGVMDRVDIITGTLGKALGGASGGYVSAHQEIVDLLRQRSRPYLFSNAVAPVVAAGSLKALEIAAGSDDARQTLQRNTALFRELMAAEGFELLPGTHPITPVMFPARTARAGPPRSPTRCSPRGSTSSRSPTPSSPREGSDPGAALGCALRGRRARLCGGLRRRPGTSGLGGLGGVRGLRGPEASGTPDRRTGPEWPARRSGSPCTAGHGTWRWPWEASRGPVAVLSLGEGHGEGDLQAAHEVAAVVAQLLSGRVHGERLGLGPLGGDVVDVDGTAAGDRGQQELHGVKSGPSPPMRIVPPRTLVTSKTPLLTRVIDTERCPRPVPPVSCAIQLPHFCASARTTVRFRVVAGPPTIFSTWALPSLASWNGLVSSTTTSFRRRRPAPPASPTAPGVAGPRRRQCPGRRRHTAPVQPAAGMRRRPRSGPATSPHRVGAPL